MAIPNTNILPGSPPLLWSNVYDAFKKINENFTSLDLATGGTAVDLETLNTNVSPADNAAYQLGTETNRWKSVYTSEYTSSPGSEFNGVWLGTAHIKGLGSIVELPAYSTVGGELIKDPTRIFFKEIQVDNNFSIVAIEGSNSFGMNSGSGVSLVVDSASESITFNNDGVTSAIAGTGIGIDTASGDVTVTNTGVTSLTNTTARPSGRTQGSGINVSAATGGISLTNTGVLSVESNTASLIISTDADTGIVTITNNAPAGNSFRYVTVNGLSGSPIEANNANGVVNFVSGQGITLSQNTVTDTVTFAIDPEFDLKGSVFGDDSSPLVDAVSNYIYGNVSATTLRTAETKIALGSGAGATTQGNLTVAIGQDAGNASQGSAGVAIGYYAGKDSQETGAVAIGYTTAQITQREGAVAIGWSAGQTNQGANSIAIGFRAGFLNQNASSIILNASGAAVNASVAGFFVNPVRYAASGKPLMYDIATSELIYSSGLEFNGTTISTVDSSAVQFDGPVAFQGTVSIEGDLRIRNDLVLDRRLTLAELEGVNNELNIYSDWARDTGISIYSAPGVESVTLTSNRIVGVVTGVGPTQKEWVFDTNGQIQFPDTRFQTGAAISIAELKVLVAAAGSYAAFQSAIAALA
jgi:hypothetical protein